MQILILGTSNSIIRGGWVDGFRSALPPGHDVINLSIGASPASQFGMACASGFQNYDLVIVEPVVNDENIHHFVGDRPTYESLMQDILATVASQTRLCVLGMTNEKFELSPSRHFLYFAELARQLGAHFVNAVAFAAGYEGRHYWDANHLISSISFALGERLAGLLPEILSVDRPAVPVSGRFSCAGIDEMGDFPCTLRESSHAAGRYGFLRLGDRIDFASEARLIGLLLDAHQTDCCVRLAGPDGSRVVSLRYETSADVFRARFIPIKNGFRTKSLEVLSADTPGVASPFELKKAPMPEAILTLSRALFWHRPEDAADRPSGAGDAGGQVLA